MNFKDPETVRLLTQVTLLDRWGLRVELPKDCLVPRVPSRLNYILWIQDLLNHLPPATEGPPRGVDIGTGLLSRAKGREEVAGTESGASAVYPLLGHAECGWSFVGTERDPMAAESARQNVARNGLQSFIQVPFCPDTN